MLIRTGQRCYRIEFGHLLFVLTIAGYALWRLVDARAASTKLQNLLLIEPLVVVAVLLCIVIAAGLIKPVSQEEQATASNAAPPSAIDLQARLAGMWHSDTGQVMAFMLLLVGYVACLPVVGFDIASFAFVSLSLLMQGERRLWLVLLMPLLFAALVTYVFKTLLLLNVPTLVG